MMTGAACVRLIVIVLPVDACVSVTVPVRDVPSLSVVLMVSVRDVPLPPFVAVSHELALFDTVKSFASPSRDVAIVSVRDEAREFVLYEEEPEVMEKMFSVSFVIVYSIVFPGFHVPDRFAEKVPNDVVTDIRAPDGSVCGTIIISVLSLFSVATDLEVTEADTGRLNVADPD